MSYSNEVLREDLRAKVKPELQPTKKRIMDNWSYFASFMGGCVSIGTFSTGASLLGVLNMTQAILAMFIGCAVISVAMALIGEAGHRYGIPFSVHLRPSFGTAGAKVPALLRAIPAIVWFGFQSWVGAGAINMSLKVLFGFDHLPTVYVLFTIVQILLSINGFRGIKWLENISSVFILGTLGYMFYVAKTRYAIEIGKTVGDIAGTWGLPFWAGTAAFLGIYATMIINSSDYARELKHETGRGRTSVIYILSILPVTLFMGLIGLMVSGATGNSDPVQVFATTLGSPVLTVITLLFVAFAQVTTNTLNNVLPPVYVFMDTFGLRYKASTWLVGILSIAVFPWKLVTAESAAGLNLFIKIYSAFLGPIFAVMVTDYYILRKQKLNVNELYDLEGTFKGVNWAGILAIFIGAACSFTFLEISWYVSLVPTMLSYALLMKCLPSARRFRAGEVSEG
ncbi:MAG: NCS1 family transporter [Pyramidobacter sp.]|jgi:NCS1 family nucleobase:cation symporter-1